MNKAKAGAARRALGIAAIWLAMLALAAIYTDRDAYTYRYDEFELPMIWESRQEAADKQAEADRKMETERQEAAARSAAGIWGREDIYDGAPDMLPARTDEPGLNLMWGGYEVRIDYVSDAPIDVSVAAVGRQPFVRGGQTTLPAAPQGNRADMSFTLLGAAPGVMLAGDLPEGAQVTNVTVRKAGPRLIDADLAAYAALLGAVLTALYVLSWDERSGSRERRRDAMILVLAALFASLPSLWYGMLDGHDLYFHLNRIEGIAAGLRAGEFPVRIHSMTLLGYGYAAPQFYPELFLYIPALLRNLGVSLVGCVSVFQMLTNLAAAIVCYASARHLFASRRIAVGAAVLYTLCVDRVVNLYVRGSLGESTAMVFFPLLAAALVDVLAGDERRWPLLTLGMFGVFMSHLLSTLFAAAFCALAAVLCAGRLLREPKRILAIVKAAALMVVCSLWFLIPFLQYNADGISTNVLFDSSRNVYVLGSLMIPFSGNITGVLQADEDFAYHVGVVPGTAILAGCALAIVRLYAQGGVLRARLSLESEKGRDKLTAALIAVGAVALLCSTEFFPWSWAVSARRPISTLAMQIQFPWRLAAIASPLLALAAAYGYLKDERHAAAGMAALTVLSVVLCGYTMTAYLQGNRMYKADFYCDTRIGQYEYTYVGTEKGALEAGRITCADAPVTLLDYDRSGSSLYARFTVDEPYVYYELPMLYYPGYRATVNGEESTVSRGTNNVLRVYNMNRAEEVEVRVWFESPRAWLFAQGASLLGAAGLIALLLRLRGRNLCGKKRAA